MKPELEVIANNDSELIASFTSAEEEAPFAVVAGERLTELPKDLYIPPGALQVFLETFSGPLDLLLYLIRKQNLDILDIPIADITRQYTRYIELMQQLELELAGEYLLMAAMLAEIKSRMLLPRPTVAGEEEEDPRAELVRRLQEYERFKKAAEDLDALPRMERDALAANAELVERKVVRLQPDVSLKEMLKALKGVLKRADMFAHHHVQREPLSVRQRMTDILEKLQSDAFVPFVSLFRPEEGRMGVTVTFIAVLELIRESLLEIVQAEPYAPLHVRSKTAAAAVAAAAAAAGASDEADAENEAALAQPALEEEDEVEPLEDWSAVSQAAVESNLREATESELPSEPEPSEAQAVEAEQSELLPAESEQSEAQLVQFEQIEVLQIEAELSEVQLAELEQNGAQLTELEQIEVQAVEPEQGEAQQAELEQTAPDPTQKGQLEHATTRTNETTNETPRDAADADDVESVDSSTEIR